ncbi:hypothetical protein HPB50_029258 [Hyalomma asiaticum]|nr:hypothetical protein HPB50_029258 [Hyalomma asiaticum]
MASMQFICEVCCMQFNGPVPHKAHLESVSHKNKVAFKLSRGGAAVSSSLGSGIAAPCPPTASPSLQVDSLRFVCSLCNVTMNSPDTLTAHNQGAQPLPSATVAPRTPPSLPVWQPPQEQLVKKPDEKDEVIDLPCRFSGIALFEDVCSKLEHLETKAHRKKKGLPL